MFSLFLTLILNYSVKRVTHSSVASNHSILTHSSPNLNIHHLVTALASDSSYMLDYVACYKFSYVCMYMNVMCCVVNSKDIGESHDGCLQLDDDHEFPAIGHSAFIY